MNIAGAVLMGMGGLLVLAGIGTVIFQMVRRPPPMDHTLQATMESLKFHTSTAYPGIVMILTGAMLLMVGGYISN